MVLEQCHSTYMHCTIYIKRFMKLQMDFLVFKKSQALILDKVWFIWPKYNERLHVAYIQWRQPCSSNVKHHRASRHKAANSIASRQSTDFKIPPNQQGRYVPPYKRKKIKRHVHQLLLGNHTNWNWNILYTENNGFSHL